MSEPVDRNPVERFAAHAVMTIGVLVVGLAGLCSATLVVIIGAPALAGGGVGDVFNDALVSLATLGFFGGVPMLIGALMFRWGRRLLKPWEKVRGDDKARTAAGWVMGLTGGVITLAAVAAAVAAIPAAFSVNPGGESFYGAIFTILAGFGLAVVAPVGPWLLIEGYRLARGPRSKT